MFLVILANNGIMCSIVLFWTPFICYKNKLLAVDYIPAWEESYLQVIRLMPVNKIEYHKLVKITRWKRLQITYKSLINIIPKDFHHPYTTDLVFIFFIKFPRRVVIFDVVTSKLLGIMTNFI